MIEQLPSALITALRNQDGFNEEAFNEVHRSGIQITSIRLNPFKLSGEFEKEEQVPWCASGRYLANRPSFIADPLFHTGTYYVQEASSMFLEQALLQTANLQSELRILDLCASPGGKSTHMVSLISKESLLVSNEIIRSRTDTLNDNLTKWGTTNCIITSNDPGDFKRLPAYFDILVADAPCSGSGMFRKDPQAVKEWTEDAVELCSMRQKRILAGAYPSLKQGGLLIYSTCSYSKEENEDIADWLVAEKGMESVPIRIERAWGIEETVSERSNSYGYRFYPDKVQGEGFFLSCFRKTEQEEGLKNPGKKLVLANKGELDRLQDWVADPQNMKMTCIQDQIFAVEDCHFEDLKILQANLYLKKSGVNLGRFAGKDFIPNHELALSLINHPAKERIELSYEDAIRYLRRDELKLAGNYKQGWSLMCYKRFVLGWAKILPNRVNNYYPKGMRILKELLPVNTAR